jgi:uncharacterized protein YbaP (TraB family)
MKPWLLASLLTVSEFAAQGYEASLAVDAHLSQQAHAPARKSSSWNRPKARWRCSTR